MAQNPYDQTCRYLARLDPVSLLCWLLRLSWDEFAFRSWLDTRSIVFPGESDRTSDTVAHLDDLGSGGVPWALLMEFQGIPDSLMFGRVLRYLAELWLNQKPDNERGSRFHVGAIVVNLTGIGRTSRDLQWPTARLVTQLGVVEWNMEEENADVLLGAMETGLRSLCLLPWIALMRGGDDPTTVERWIRLATQEPDPRRRSDYAGLVQVLAEKAGRKNLWKEKLMGWGVEESTVVNEWVAAAKVKAEAQGRADGRMIALLEVLTEKFATLPADLTATIRGTTDLERLRAWTSAAVKAPTLEEFRRIAGM